MIGKTAKNVPAERAAEYIFGYTLENDVSDRGGRADARHGSDWLIGKSHDTFAPLGPFVVPRQSVAPDELMEWVAGRVAPHKKIRRMAVVDAIPKSASGKILRRVLVEQERAARS